MVETWGSNQKPNTSEETVELVAITWSVCALRSVDEPVSLSGDEVAAALVTASTVKNALRTRCSQAGLVITVGRGFWVIKWKRPTRPVQFSTQKSLSEGHRPRKRPCTVLNKFVDGSHWTTLHVSQDARPSLRTFWMHPLRIETEVKGSADGCPEEIDHALPMS